MRYDNYADLNLSWIHTIPFHWKIAKNRQLLHEINCKTETGNEDLLMVSQYTGISRKERADSSTGMRLAESQVGYKLVHVDDIVMNIMLAWNGSTGASKYNGIVSPAYSVFQCHECVNPWYIHYLFRTPVLTSFFKANSTGIIESRLRLYPDVLLRLYSIVPPRTEQDQIVRYLDWQVSKINKLIAAKKKQIALLDEHRTATINVAVTRGVKDTRALKNSGMKWLPKIPTDWETIPAKALFENRHELRHDTDEMMAATQKYGIIAQKKYMETEGRRIVLATDSLDKWLHVEPDDFIISLRSFQGGLERCIEAGCVTWHYVVLRPNDGVLPAFYRWFFKSSSYISALQHTSDFIRDGQDLRYSNFVKVRLLRISLQEQAEIAEYLDHLIPQYDVAIAGKQKEIDALHELRTRIISDVVTGQIDVRGIEVPDFEMVEEIDESADEDDVPEETEEEEE